MIAHMYNPSQRRDMNTRIEIFRSICDYGNGICTGTPFNINDDRGDFYNFVRECGDDIDKSYIFFIHDTDASVNDVNANFLGNWPQNVYAIFYGGEGVYGESPHDNIQLLNAWFPDEAQVGSNQFNRIVQAVCAVAMGQVADFTAIDINEI